MPDADGGTALELHAEGTRLARASAAADILADMESMLGSKRAAVEAHLREALVHYLEDQLAAVER